MASRLPESRLQALKAGNAAPENVFQSNTKLTNEDAILGKKMPFKRLISIHLGDKIPLKTEKILNWPSKTDFLCLHCAEPIKNAPLPAVKYHDTHDDRYWVYGYFCRPCCSLAHVSEQKTSDQSRCVIWTQLVLRKYFNCLINESKPAPPRSALKKFGGSMDLEDFYGSTNNSYFKSSIEPPFVTFAMYTEMIQKTNEDDNLVETKVYGLKRPPLNVLLSRQPAKSEQTGKIPLILEFLASKAISASKLPNAAILKEGDAELNEDDNKSLNNNMNKEEHPPSKKPKSSNGGESKNIDFSAPKKKSKVLNSLEDSTSKVSNKGSLTQYIVKTK